MKIRAHHRQMTISIPISMSIVFDRLKRELGQELKGGSYTAQKLFYQAMTQHMSGPDVDLMRRVFEGKIAQKEQTLNVE